MKKMKSSLFLAAMMAVSSLSFAQSNDKGVIQIGLGYGGLIGGGKFSESGQSISLLGARGIYGIRAQYGLAKNFSAGVYLRREGAAYTTNDVNYSGLIVTNSGAGFGIEAKYYIVNKDRFNFYGAPSIGMTVGNTYTNYNGYTSNKVNTAGVNYGVGLGINWYWADFIGMSADVAYYGVSLSGKDNSVSPSASQTLSSGGVFIGVGLITKFGGK